MPPTLMEITEIVLSDGSLVPIKGWGKLRQQVDKYGTVKTLWIPLLSADIMRGEALGALANNIYATYIDADGKESIEIASLEDKSGLDMDKVTKATILSSLESSAIQNNVISPADIDENVGIRTLMGDMVNQWGKGLTVDPMEALGRVKKYMGGMTLVGKGDPNDRDYQRLQQAQIDMARNIASIPDDKTKIDPDTGQPIDMVDAFANREMSKLKQLEGELARGRAAKATGGISGNVAAAMVPPQAPPDVAPQEIEQAARASAPGAEVNAPATVMPQFGSTFPNKTDLSNPEGDRQLSAEAYGALDVAGASNAEGDRRQRLQQQAKAKWLNLVEQARNEMGKRQRTVLA